MIGIDPEAMKILERGGTAYRKTVNWTSKGGKTGVTSDYCDNQQQAIDQAWILAKKFGWDEPKWYQFRRWFDEKPPKPETPPR